MKVDIKIPSVGENIESGTITSVSVKAGDTVKKDDILLELETGKAVVEIPAEYDGSVLEVRTEAGAEVKIGQVVLVMETVSGPAARLEPEEKESQVTVAPSVPDQQAINKKEYTPAVVSEESVENGTVHADETASVIEAGKPANVPASPSVRRFAREIGIDLQKVSGSGPGGRISIEDVKTFSKRKNSEKAGRDIHEYIKVEALPDFSKWGSVRTEQMSTIRQVTAQHLSYSWSTIPHVTQFDYADITELEALRKEFAPEVAGQGGKLTMTAILAYVTAKALKAFPVFNSSIDMENRRIIYKDFVNIGIAVDTPGGLLVPVIRNADRKSISEIATELNMIAEKARNRKISPSDLEGGTFTISNLGGITGTGFTPIINAPEVAIMGVSSSEWKPVYKDGEWIPRLMLPLSLSYDHRIIDGADGARFTLWFKNALQKPFRLML